jgi:release factor glutamine methyltransferase
MPTADALLKQARADLAHVDTPALDARLLLQAATGLSHAELVADPALPLSAEAEVRFAALVARRVAHEPVSRIRGRREFYGRDFIVTPDVLDPRADTEVLIEAALALLPNDRRLRLLDLGTGSGIIAVTVLAERERSRAVAVDVSSAALLVTEQNAKAHGVDQRLQRIEGSWFDRVEGQFDAILSNPPYIEDKAVNELSRDVRDYDPHLALAAGVDGLDCYRAIAAGASARLTDKGFIAVEIGAGQEQDVAAIFGQHGLELASQHRDLGGHVRCLVFLGPAQNR